MSIYYPTYTIPGIMILNRISRSRTVKTNKDYRKPVKLDTTGVISVVSWNICTCFAPYLYSTTLDYLLFVESL